MSQFSHDGLDANDSSKKNNNQSKEKYSLNFSISHKSPSDSYFNLDSMSSNIISETSLEDDHILLRKKSLLKRKFISSEKIYYGEIVSLDLVKSSSSSLYSTIKIEYSKNGYSKRFLSLSSSDSFAVNWFYDALLVRHSYFRSNLDKVNFDSNESNWMSDNNLNEGSYLDDNADGTDKFDKSDENDEDGINKESVIKQSKQSKQSNQSKQSVLSDFMSSIDKELSEEEKRKLKKKMQFERCSSGEY